MNQKSQTISQHQLQELSNVVPGPPPQDLRGDVAAHGFWRRGTTAVFDIRITDTDCASYRQRDPATILRSQEDAKKRRYGEACRQSHRHFTPLVYSIDRMKGREARAARKQLAAKAEAQAEAARNAEKAALKAAEAQALLLSRSLEEARPRRLSIRGSVECHEAAWAEAAVSSWLWKPSPPSRAGRKARLVARGRCALASTAAVARRAGPHGPRRVHEPTGQLLYSNESSLIQLF